MASISVESDFIRAVNYGELVPVLMYHKIYHKNNPPKSITAGERRYAIDSNTFCSQMEFLYTQGFRTIPLEACIAASKGFIKGLLPEKAIAITFDDGNESDFSIASPILEHFNFSASFFVTTDNIGTNGFMNREQIRSMLKSNMVVGSHTVTHRFLNVLDEKDLFYELFESKKILESITGKKIDQISFPGGRFNDFVLDAAARAGYDIVCTSNVNSMETAGDVVAQSISEMVPQRLSRIAITQDIGMTLFKRIVTLDELELSRRQKKQVVLNSIKHVLGDKVYNALWEQYWTMRSLLKYN